MGMQFTKMPVDAFQKLQLNAGILVDSFVPATGVIGNILGATSGGINFASNPSFEDFGADMDNCPPEMKELKRLISYSPQMSGTFLTCSPGTIKSLIGAADIDAQDDTKVIPRQVLLSTDFNEVWWIGDYSDVNTGDDAGFLAIHLLNSLNQSGFNIQSGKDAKGQINFEYHGHYSLAAQEKVPFEIYCKAGSGTTQPSIFLDKHSVTVETGGTVTLTATVIPDDATVSWSSGSSTVATVSEGVVTAGSSAGNTIITASITEGGVTYNDTCTVVVTGD